MGGFSRHSKGIFFASLSGMLYGFLAYFGVQIMQEGNCSISNMLFWRFLLTTFVFLGCLVFSKGKVGQKLQISYILGASFFYGICAMFYFMASQYIGTGLAMVIFFSYPTLVALLNWLFHRHKITLVYYISFVLMGVGIFLLSDKDQMSFDLYGIFLAVLSGLSYAFYMIISKKEAHNLTPVFSSFLVSLGNSILFLIISFVDQSFFVPHFSSVWVNLLGVALIATVLPIFLLLISLKYISSTKASIVSVLEPVVTVILGVVLLGESLSMLQIIGVIILLAGTLSIQFDKSVEIQK